MIAATRASALARWQTDHIGELLAAVGVDMVPLPLTTDGDRRLDQPLADIGGKGVFVTDVQSAVLDGRAHIAVHSAKDLPGQTPEGLVIAAVPVRGAAHDVLVGSSLDDLGIGAVVATGSQRRAAVLLARRPDLQIVGLRGNIATRLGRLGATDHEGDGPIAAVVVAAAAIDRLGRVELGLADTAMEAFDVESMIPQVGQGTLAVECRSDDIESRERLQAIEHAPTRRCLDAERAFLVELGGDCSLPAGAHAAVDSIDGRVRVRGVLADRPGGTVVTAELMGDDGVAAGRELAIELRSRLG